MLDSIPVEVLTLVGYHLSIETLQPPTSLLLASKHFNASLSPRSNKDLYSRVYRYAFDTSAAVRRCSAEVTAEKLAKELERRVRALKRLGRALRDRKVGQVQDGDLWVLYILLVEHDELNLSHLFTPEFNIIDFLRAYHNQNLLIGAIEAGYPEESIGRSLIIWIAWILYTYGIGREESPDEEEERLFVLRPYVFAAQKYDVYFGPWTIHDLPLATSSLKQPLDTEFDHPFKADLTPKPRGTVIEYYGEEISLSPPILSHAAILRFFKREEEEDEDEVEEGGGNGVISPFTSLTGAPNQTPSQATARDDRTNAHRPCRPDPDPEKSRFLFPTPDTSSSNSGSASHDRDWKRLTSCYDPTVSQGMNVRDWRDAFDGCWEGNFSFFEFEAFKEMLAGHSRALYEGPFGEQAQVWKLTETFVRPKKVKPVDEEAEVEGQADDGDEERHGNGDEDEDMADSNGTPSTTTRRDKGKGKADPKGLPLHGPATNAGFPTDLPSPIGAGLATPSAEEYTLRETIKQQVEAIEGYEIVPPSELDEAIDNQDQEQGLEILLTGTGHSAWGRFILKGRVRAWDGMATLVKEYAPDSRGKWIYRGYVLAGNVFVGRWRDTFTPEEFFGYEGTFILNRRE